MKAFQHNETGEIVFRESMNPSYPPDYSGAIVTYLASDGVMYRLFNSSFILHYIPCDEGSDLTPLYQAYLNKHIAVRVLMRIDPGDGAQHAYLRQLADILGSEE